MTKRKDPKDLKKAGRPTKYCQEMADLICERVATHDVGLDRLYEMYDDMPHRVNINIWRRKYPEFRSKYAQAKREQIEFITEEILEIADDARNDWMESIDDSGKVSYKINSEHVQRSRLRIDTRKWLASKLAPKVYGDSGEEKIDNSLHDDAMKRRHDMDELNKKDF